MLLLHSNRVAFANKEIFLVPNQNSAPVAGSYSLHSSGSGVSLLRFAPGRPPLGRIAVGGGLGMAYGRLEQSAGPLAPWGRCRGRPACPESRFKRPN